MERVLVGPEGDYEISGRGTSPFKLIPLGNPEIYRISPDSGPDITDYMAKVEVEKLIEARGKLDKRVPSEAVFYSIGSACGQFDHQFEQKDVRRRLNWFVAVQFFKKADQE